MAARIRRRTGHYDSRAARCHAAPRAAARRRGGGAGPRSGAPKRTGPPSLAGPFVGRGSRPLSR
ncbi:hypothetical protein DF122_26115 [Burkholderia pseudomallei]|uniref:Uncharacterized protein n=2 Tax=Burkholderia pseudomallei TaxID=28450 RepID=A0AAX0UBB9_BURPE|nr:hypothetical protein BURPS1106A_3042 [Burkholderia pseudomallei 1106a]AFR16928.1 hypothetical protein BPC006_I3081 [Burkholderia pseudomallei BPC006]ARK49949.1 hypothetical protein BOC35_28105 [Burkholderia pseudomallei]EES26258.1 hypothetical protein BURPS1106B_A2258 [Burkholderia pseudomallei 1106b]ARK53131.1 hypothetical protein BOC36_08295 [Burkholderia pseudomallei]